MSTQNDTSMPQGSIGEIDRRYARALFSVGGDTRPMLAAERALDALALAIDAHEPLQRALVSPLCSPRAKASVLATLNAALGGPDEVGSFTRLVAYKGRADRLRAIAGAYKRLVADHRGASRIDVYTARPLPEKRQSDLIAAVVKIFGEDIHVDMHVDPALVGGVKMQMGSRVVDASIRGRIDRIAQHLHGK